MFFVELGPVVRSNPRLGNAVDAVVVVMENLKRSQPLLIDGLEVSIALSERTPVRLSILPCGKTVERWTKASMDIDNTSYYEPKIVGAEFVGGIDQQTGALAKLMK